MGGCNFFFGIFHPRKKKIGSDTSVIAHPCVVVRVQQKSFAGGSKLAKADKRTPKPTNKASGASLAAGQKRDNSKPATKSKEAVNSGRGCGRPGAASRGSGIVASRARAKAKQFSDCAHGSDTSGWVRMSRHIFTFDRSKELCGPHAKVACLKAPNSPWQASTRVALQLSLRPLPLLRATRNLLRPIRTPSCFSFLFFSGGGEDLLTSPRLAIFGGKQTPMHRKTPVPNKTQKEKTT